MNDILNTLNGYDNANAIIKLTIKLSQVFWMVKRILTLLKNLHQVHWMLKLKLVLR